MYIKMEHYSNFFTFEKAILVNVLGHYLRNYGISMNKSFGFIDQFRIEWKT